MRQRTATARAPVSSRKAHGNDQSILTRKNSVRGFRQSAMVIFLGDYLLILSPVSPGAWGRRRAGPLLCNPRFPVLLRHENPVNFLKPAPPLRLIFSAFSRRPLRERAH
jgi:hypothetical protein